MKKGLVSLLLCLCLAVSVFGTFSNIEMYSVSAEGDGDLVDVSVTINYHRTSESDYAG